MTVKTVSSIPEWDVYAAGVYAAGMDDPRAHLVGDLADQLRALWGVNKHVPVVLYVEDWECDDSRCSCCENEGADLILECDGRTLPFNASPYGRDPDELPCWLREEQRRREVQEREAAARKVAAERARTVLQAQETSIFAAMQTVEDEGYRNDQEWHDKLMNRLGIE